MKKRKTCQVCKNYIREDEVILTVCKKCSAELVPYKSKKSKSLLKDKKKTNKTYYYFKIKEGVQK